MPRCKGRAVDCIAPPTAARPGRSSPATALPDGEWGRVGVAVAPDGKRVYAVIDAGKKSGLYRSDDGGDTWTLANGDPRLTSRAWYFSWVRLIPAIRTSSTSRTSRSIARKTAARPSRSFAARPGGDDYHQLWVDPKNSSHLILGIDQGTTVSLNRGKTWSSWYNQPTAQFYHVITDNEFPYHVYGAQQDSGSIAVPSRTDHGQITARDWFMVGGGESGWHGRPTPAIRTFCMPRGVYGSVVRWDRRTSLSQDITPWPMPQLWQRNQSSASIATRGRRCSCLLAGREERALYGHAVRDEDHRRRTALEADQPRPDRCSARTPPPGSAAGPTTCRMRSSAALVWSTALRRRR